jgi:transposase
MSKVRKLFPQMKAYSSDLSDTEWALLEPLIPPAKPGGRPRSMNMRQILNGIFYVLRGGCAWRLLPHDYPAWSTVYDSFRKWRNEGVWERIVTTLRERLRVQAGRKATRCRGIIDSQSVKTTERGGPQGTLNSPVGRRCLKKRKLPKDQATVKHNWADRAGKGETHAERRLT